jgi:hypothetical protein
MTLEEKVDLIQSSLEELRAELRRRSTAYKATLTVRELAERWNVGEETVRQRAAAPIEGLRPYADFVRLPLFAG